MKTLVAYYSRQGHTEKVAKELASQLHAEIEKIEPVHADNIGIGAFKAILGMRSPIKPFRTDLDGIDLLIVASPVWAHKVPPYTNDYLFRLTSASGKPCAVLVEMKSSGAESAIAAMKRRLEQKGMQWSLRPPRWNTKWRAGRSPPGSPPLLRI